MTEITRELISDCVHCGFCLPTCPTYGALWREEMDSPRGRIHLMAGLLDGTVPLTDATVEHFDRCLGCMACVTACPSGVQYDRLIEQTREYVEERYDRAPAGRCTGTRAGGRRGSRGRGGAPRRSAAQAPTRSS